MRKERGRCKYQQATAVPYALHKPAPRGIRGSSKPKSKTGGFYLSLVDGRVERHATWSECQGRVNGVSGARFKKVSSAEEELAVLKLWGSAPGK